MVAWARLFKFQERSLGTLAKSQTMFTNMYNPKLTPPREAWVETFIDREKDFVKLIELHPRVFAVFPRIDYVSETVLWQKTYRDINYTSMPTRNELPGGTRRPWPQKGTGRARHKCVNSPIWLKGGWARGPRGPVTHFRPKPYAHLTSALTSMLTIKLAQNDLRIVDTLESWSSTDPADFTRALKNRCLGPSTLIVDKTDTFSEALVAATSSLNHINLMSTYGLNTLSMCKHETLIMTERAIREIEEKLLFQLLRVDLCNTNPKYKV